MGHWAFKKTHHLTGNCFLTDIPKTIEPPQGKERVSVNLPVALAQQYREMERGIEGQLVRPTLSVSDRWDHFSLSHPHNLVLSPAWLFAFILPFH